MGAIAPFFIDAVAPRRGSPKVGLERSAAFVAILRALKVLRFAPFTTNHIFGDPGRGRRWFSTTGQLNAKYSNAKMADCANATLIQARDLFWGLARLVTAGLARNNCLHTASKTFSGFWWSRRRKSLNQFLIIRVLVTGLNRGVRESPKLNDSHRSVGQLWGSNGTSKMVIPDRSWWVCHREINAHN